MTDPIARSGTTRRTAAATDDFELALFRALAERRITRRELLETVARVGPLAALAPILAACGASATPPPSAPPSVAAPPSAPGSVAPVATPSAAPTPVPSPEGEVIIYNWDAYIGENTVKQFEDATGIKVHYEKFPDADDDDREDPDRRQGRRLRRRLPDVDRDPGRWSRTASSSR